MEVANDNLLRELERKEAMIEKYELDKHGLSERKGKQEVEMGKLFAQHRNRSEDVMGGLEGEISKVQEELRFEQGKTSKLKGQYQRLYELLCSSASKNIHQTFNNSLVSA